MFVFFFWEGGGEGGGGNFFWSRKEMLRDELRSPGLNALQGRRHRDVIVAQAVSGT